MPLGLLFNVRGARGAVHGADWQCVKNDGQGDATPAGELARTQRCLMI